MFVYPLIDRDSGEIVIVYRDGEVLSAEVYKKHVDKLWTHFNAKELNSEYLATLRLPSADEIMEVRAAVRMYSTFSRIDGMTLSPFPLKDWTLLQEARSKALDGASEE